MPAPSTTSTPNNSSGSSPSGGNPTSASPSPTCANAILTPSEAILRADINRRLLESGELDKLTTHLTLLLRESGWREQTLTSCTKALRDPELHISNYHALYNAVEREAMESVEHGVKVEVVKRIREVLQGMLEV